MAAVGSRTGVRTAVVWDYLRATLDELGAAGSPLRILDAGGGSGGFAVPLAQLGHEVTVVDPSPDSLAALELRTLGLRGWPPDADAAAAAATRVAG